MLGIAEGTFADVTAQLGSALASRHLTWDAPTTLSVSH
jgi:hypothetical protein